VAHKHDFKAFARVGVTVKVRCFGCKKVETWLIKGFTPEKAKKIDSLLENREKQG
jgi:hypothetical protein